MHVRTSWFTLIGSPGPLIFGPSITAALSLIPRISRKCNGSHRSGVLKLPVRDYNQLEQCGKYSHHLKHDFRIAKHEADLLADELSAFQSLFEIFSHISHPLEVKVMKLLVSNYRKKFPIPKQNFASKRGMDGVSQVRRRGWGYQWSCLYCKPHQSQ
ncbi:hypothetical protein N7451_008832 [Penicillium sp. IBT 35674x]|nr:hypothetical protein LCP963914a_9894 [Penicillium roqueforti]KAJ5993108.1 hypothetical protein N7451_008832 [Penicillium sp. IBT 35674x]